MTATMHVDRPQTAAVLSDGRIIETRSLQPVGGSHIQAATVALSTLGNETEFAEALPACETPQSRQASGTRQSEDPLCPYHGYSTGVSTPPVCADARAGRHIERGHLLCRRHGSDRGAAALAIRQADAEALIAGAAKFDGTGRSRMKQSPLREPVGLSSTAARSNPLW
jgi:hypothetical protein